MSCLSDDENSKPLSPGFLTCKLAGLVLTPFMSSNFAKLFEQVMAKVAEFSSSVIE
jgi:UPF0716 family protein affecting phage T7 exclusion